LKHPAWKLYRQYSAHADRFCRHPYGLNSNFFSATANVNVFCDITVVNAQSDFFLAINAAEKPDVTPRNRRSFTTGDPGKLQAIDPNY
jgi:hypothetical protein